MNTLINPFEPVFIDGYVPSLDEHLTAGGSISSYLARYFQNQDSTDIRSNGTTIVDSSTTGTDRPEQPARWLVLNGVDQYATTGAAGDWSTTDWTLEVIFEVDTLTANFQTVLSQQNGTGTGRTWLNLNSTSFNTIIGDVAASVPIAADTPATGTVYHCVLTHDESAEELTFWINGVEKYTVSKNMGAATGVFVLGANKSLSELMDGNIYHVGLIESVATSDEIAAMYAQLTTPEVVVSGLPTYKHKWNCQDNSSTTLRDSGTG